jgi:glycosyltransferase involved in cell wall biosynthesis
VRIVRAGRQWTVHWSAFRRYRGRLSTYFDVVIDEVNTIPFFTPLWSDIPSVMFIHQLAREVWWYESAFPLSAIGFIAEPIYLRLYRGVPVLTVSESTRSDLRRLGLEGTITIIPEGVEPIKAHGSASVAGPIFLYVGRLAPSKRIHHVVKAFALFRREMGIGHLDLIGTGPKRYQNSLVRLAQKLGMDDCIEFRGRVSNSDKHRLMAGATALLMASVREGWGLVVTEANACGTPAIVYDVPGLRDSVRNGSTGLVVRPDPRALCDAMKLLVTQPDLRAQLAAEALRWSGTLSIESMASLVAKALEASAPAGLGAL